MTEPRTSESWITVPATTEHVEVNNVRLWVRRWQARRKTQKAPLVLCDGLGCDGYAWRYLIEQQHEHRDIIQVTYRGHGRSEVPADLGTVNMSQLVDDLSLVLAHFAWPPSVLCGHSMGVQLCLEFYAAHPERVVGLALLSGSDEYPITTWHGPVFAADPLGRTSKPLGNRVMQRAFEHITGASIRHFPRIKKLWAPLMRTEFALDATIDGELTRELLNRSDFAPYMEHLAEMDMRVFAALARDLARHSAKSVLPTVDVPTFVLGGSRDKFCPAWVSERLFSGLGACGGYKEYMGLVLGSHVAQLEEPAIVGKALDRLLFAVDGAPQAH